VKIVVFSFHKLQFPFRCEKHQKTSSLVDLKNFVPGEYQDKYSIKSPTYNLKFIMLLGISMIKDYVLL
jgi:hypothetical protein